MHCVEGKVFRSAGVTLLLGACFAHVFAQEARAPAVQSVTPEAAGPNLPPSAVFTDTLAPFERVRSDLSNWSEIEMTAFRNMASRAKAQCQELEKTPHEGEQALALARLCSLAMDWDGTYSAARWYTRKSAPKEESQHLAFGFSLLLQADLNLQAIPRALEELKEMKDRLPLSLETDAIFTYTVSALEVVQPDACLEAALLRQPDLLRVIATVPVGTASISPGQAEEEAWHTLALLHGAGRRVDEEHARAELLTAVDEGNSSYTILDSYLAQRGRTRYEWLGKSLPASPVDHKSYPGARRAEGEPPVELLIIEREDAADVRAFSLGIDALRKRLPPKGQATLVLIKSAEAIPSVRQQAASPEVHAVYTKQDLLRALGATSGPLFVLKDSEAHVKFIGTGSPTWMNPQMQAELLLMRELARAQPQEDR